MEVDISKVKDRNILMSLMPVSVMPETFSENFLSLEAKGLLISLTCRRKLLPEDSEIAELYGISSQRASEILDELDNAGITRTLIGQRAIR